MAGTIVVDRIESDSSYTSSINVASKANFTGGFQVGGQDAAFGSFRNRIHNGEFIINQRANTNHTIAISGSSSGFSTVDRWGFYYYNNSGTFTPNVSIKHTSDHPIKGSNGKCLEIVCNTADTPANNVDFFAMTHGVEAQYISDIFSGANAQPMTLSFWVKSNKIGTYCVEIRDTQSGSGGTYIIKEYTVIQSGVWEKKTLSIPAPTFSSMPNTSDQGLYIQFHYASGLTPTYAPGVASSINNWASVYSTNGAASTNQANLFSDVGNYIRMTDVQLEVGNTATAFERRPYGTELAICQRYLYAPAPGVCGPASAFSATRFDSWLQFPVTMRATPSGTYASGTNYYRVYLGGNSTTLSAPQTNGINQNGVLMWSPSITGVTTGAGGWFEFLNAPAGSILFSAEL